MFPGRTLAFRLKIISPYGNMVHSRQAFRSLWKIWRICGIHPPRHFRGLYSVYSTLLNITTVTYLPLGMIIYSFFVADLATVINNLYFYIGNIEASLKFLAIYISLDQLYVVNRYFKILDEQPKTEEQCERLKSSIRIAKKVFNVYWIMFSLAVISQALGTFFGDEQKLITDIWLP